MSSRRGFTLVELLVVIAIIGILVGLLLPAVNSAREQGRQTTCRNNLHQLQIACQQHVDKFNFYPSGGWGSNWVGLPDQGTGATQPGGWIYQLLPYMDQEALHDLGKGSATGPQTLANANAKLVTTALPGLNCPTRRTSKAYPLTIDPLGFGKAGRTDYAANGGSVYVPLGASPTIAPAPAGFAWPDLTLLGFNGIVGTHSQIAPASITDNKDTTYLFGEKYMRPEDYITGADPGDLYSAMSGDDVSTIRWGSALPAQDRLSSSGSAPTNGQNIFGSSHSAGWNAAFVSGNVQLIGWGIDAAMHNTMSTRNGTRNGRAIVDPSQIPH